jgi:hypothetical protein
MKPTGEKGHKPMSVVDYAEVMTGIILVGKVMLIIAAWSQYDEKHSTSRP